jgi:transcriptional regulator with XRE-family HTH domain
MESAQEWFARELREFENDPVFHTEGVLIELGEEIWARMEQLGLSKADLAHRLGVSQAAITRMLSGSPNMTLLKLVTVAMALDADVEVRLKPKGAAAQAAAKPRKRVAARRARPASERKKVAVG